MDGLVGEGVMKGGKCHRKVFMTCDGVFGRMWIIESIGLVLFGTIWY